MGLYLFSARDEGFSAWGDTRDTEIKLETKDEVRIEVLDSLREIIKASKHFDWNVDLLITQAKAQLTQEEKE